MKTVNKLNLSSLTKQGSRLTFSRVFQYATGHALIGAWFNIIRVENPSNTCRYGDNLKTIDHKMPKKTEGQYQESSRTK